MSAFGPPPSPLLCANVLQVWSLITMVHFIWRKKWGLESGVNKLSAVAHWITWRFSRTKARFWEAALSETLWSPARLQRFAEWQTLPLIKQSHTEASCDKHLTFELHTGVGCVWPLRPPLSHHNSFTPPSIYTSKIDEYLVALYTAVFCSQVIL